MILMYKGQRRGVPLRSHFAGGRALPIQNARIDEHNSLLAGVEHHAGRQLLTLILIYVRMSAMKPGTRPTLDLFVLARPECAGDPHLDAAGHVRVSKVT
jgi:hypothetical protein